MIGEGVKFHEPIKKDKAVESFKQIYAPKKIKQYGLPSITVSN